MLPVYTRLLTPADYGVLQLLDTTVEIASLLFTAGAINGVSRFYFKTDDAAARKALISTAFLVQAGLAALAALAIIALAQPIHRFILGGDGTPMQVRLAAVNLFAGILLAVPLLRLQLLERATSYSGIALSKLVVQLTLNIVFVVVFRLGVTGVLLSTLIANLAIGGGLAVSMLRETGVRIDPHARAELARFGRPVRLTALGSYINHFGDRYFLSASWGTAAVGTYGLAYQFGFGFFQFFSAPVTKAWDPIRFQLANRPEEERNPVFLRMFELTSLLFVTAFTAIAVAARPIVLVLTTPAFYSAERLIPIIVGAYLVQAWTSSFSFQISVSERTVLLTKATWLSACLTFALYAILIPAYGGQGAAWATLLGFAARALLAYRYAQAAWPIPYNWSSTLRLVSLSIAAVLATQLGARDSLVGSLALSAGVFLSYLVAAVLLAVSREDRTRLVTAVRRRAGLRDLIG